MKTEFKKIKQSNVIAIGGMIASGKTTLMHNLAKRLNCELIDEIDPNDEIQNVLLKALYEKKNEVAPAVFQLYFFLTRFENYKRATKDDSLFLVDRTVFEDRLFAHRNMAKDPVTFGFYDVLWTNKIHELIYSVGIPKLYIIIDIEWDLFKERLFERDRNIETDNYKINEDYFKNLWEGYTDYLVQICKTYGINYIVVSASDEQDAKLDKIIDYLNA